MAQAGLSGIKATPKGLRHAFAIAGVSAGIPLPTIQKWMGHARAETTAIYLDFVGEDERAWARRI
jgi:integrase/recombinase XerD